MPREIARMNVGTNKILRAVDSEFNEAVISSLGAAKKRVNSSINLTNKEYNELAMRSKMLSSRISEFEARFKLMPDSEEKMQAGIKLISAKNKLGTYDELMNEKFELLERLRGRSREIDEYVALSKTNPGKFVKLVESDPNFEKEFGNMEPVRNALMNRTEKLNQIYRAKSPYLNDDRKFFEEYMRTKEKPDSDFSKLWVANPENKKKLEILATDSQKYRKLNLVEDPEKIREMLSKMKRTDAAIALGVPAAALTGVGLAYFAWADDNVKEIQYKSEALIDKLDDLRVSGAGEDVLLDAKNAVAALNGSSERIDMLLHNPKDSAGEIGKNTEILRIGKEKLDTSLQKWGNVINNSTNPDDAQSVGRALKTFSNDIGDRLNKLADKVGMPRSKQAPDFAGPSTPSMAGQKKTTREDIIALQEYLSDFDPRIGPTGVLDSATIGMLKQLESKYNRLGNTSDFTGLLVNPAEGMAISLEDLKDLLKYK